MAIMDFGSARILEIGTRPFIAAVPGAAAHFFDARPRQAQPFAVAEGSRVIALRELPESLRRADLVVVTDPPSWGPWEADTLARTLFDRAIFSSRYRPAAPFAMEALRFAREKPVAVLDFSDYPYVERGQFYLLNRATLYFKRELPIDEWRLFMKTRTPRHPSRRFRSDASLRQLLDKVRPLSLGPLGGTETAFPADAASKASDLFYAGMTGGVPARERALEELRVLAGEGFLVDAPEAPLSRSDFLRRCATAWITLSPEGLGWDCHRHYEAALCGSVPLMNYPSIRRHAPFTEGIDALFYPPEQGGLAAIVRRWLADRPALARMGEAARSHAQAHHTAAAIARYVVDATMQAASLAEIRAGTVPAAPLAMPDQCGPGGLQAPS